MKNMSEVSTVALNRRVSNTKDTLVMMIALLDLVVLLLMMTTTQKNNSSLNQAKRRLYLQNERGKDRSWYSCATLDPRVDFEILDDVSQHGTY